MWVSFLVMLECYFVWGCSSACSMWGGFAASFVCEVFIFILFHLTLGCLPGLGLNVG